MSLRSVCLFRLSALGDVTHLVPVIHALRARWPGIELTWVIGSLEARLMADLPGVRLIVIDKKNVLKARRELREKLGEQQFDALLLMQVSLRAGLVSTAIRATRRIGYPRSRSKELHSWFVKEHLPDTGARHVADQLLAFAQFLGADVTAPVWQMPVPEEAHVFASTHLPGSQPTLIISPSSSHPCRNWTAAGYAAVAAHAHARGFRVALVGSKANSERVLADAILARCTTPVLDLVGKDTLKQLLALLQRASVVLTPDSGPAHFGSSVGTATIALHAATDPRRSGPYRFVGLAVDAYDRAAHKFRGKAASQLPWGTKIEEPGVMELITVEEVCARFDQVAESLSLPGQRLTVGVPEAATVA